MDEGFLGLTVAAWTAVFALGLLIVASIQARIYCLMHRTTKVIERAWVSLETLEISVHPDHSRTITVGLKNSGRTPARIITANITVRGSEAVGGDIGSVDDLPDVPVYDEVSIPPPAVLVAGDVSRMRHTISHVDQRGCHFNLLTLRPGENRRLWIYGFIRYTDGLSKTERKYGWAREYDPVLSAASERFRFAHINKPGYNYAD